jgi:predicted nuclease with TOPRIM domain
MARALKVRLIAIKKELHAEKFRVEGQQSEIKQKIAELESEKAELDKKHSTLVGQIDQAEKYSRTHAPDVILTCVRCFVVQGALQNMLPTKAKVLGIKRYKCKNCGEELNRDELGIPA